MSATFISPDATNETEDAMNYLTYAFSIVSDYISEDLSGLLKKKLGIEDKVAASVKRKSSKTLQDTTGKKVKKENDENAFAETDLVKDKAPEVKLTTKEKALAKAATGTKNCEGGETFSGCLVKSWAGGEDGCSTVNRLLPTLVEKLAPASVFYLLLLRENKPKEWLKTFQQLGFSGSIIKERKIRGEYLYILKIVRCNSINRSIGCDFPEESSTLKASNYIVSGDGKSIRELLQFCQPHRSWFIDESIQADGNVYLTTQIDPLFLILPYLVESCSEMASPLDSFLVDQDFPDIFRLQKIVTEKQMDRVRNFRSF
uniref:Rnh202 triple barrel domain-containing protein n=1 Tax=Phlebotomus papatasi TaxID=29031 RepID=A0A1B0EYV7_PHLPP